MLHIDALSIASIGEIGIFLQWPNDIELELTLKLDFKVTNNNTEYKALIAGMKLVQQIKARKLIAYIDS